jgi:MFS family permease
MKDRPVSKKTVAAIVIGNALEWYDFIVYSFMMVFIARLFFPSSDPANSLLAAAATFGAAFFMRPLGGIILGVYADKKGRKAAMTLVIALMSIALLMIACAPTYAQAGVFAPIFLVLARLLQGFSAAGEFGSSSALLIELSPVNRQGLYGSWQMFGQTLAIFIGGAVGMLLTRTLSVAQLESWGWRIPFVFGLIIAPIGWYIRRHLDEDRCTAGKQAQKNDFMQICRENMGKMLLSIGLVVSGTTSFYVNLIYLPTYATSYLHLSMNDAFVAVAAGSLTGVILIPFFGALSDRIGRKPIIVTALLLYFVSVYPLFSWMVSNPSLNRLIIIEIIFCVFLAAYFSVFTTILARLFPYEIRATGLSISNNLAIMLFGGFGQFIVTWLIKITASVLAPSFYVTLGVAVSLFTAILLPSQKRINHEYT